MKRCLFVIMSALSLASCKEKKFGAFVIAGKVENVAEQKIYLEEIPFTGESPVILDSATLKKSGTFELRSMAKEESLFGLVVNNKLLVLFINDENNIRVRLDVNNFRGYTIEGSTASEQLHELLQKLWTTDSTYASVLREQDSLASDSLRTVLNLKLTQTLEKRRNLLDVFIKKTNSPAAICYAVGMYDPGVDASHKKELLDAAAARFPEHSGINRMRSLYALQVQPAYDLLNQPAPEIKLPTPNGDTIALSSLRGKYVLVDFWASWCGPCRRENPNVVAAYNKYKDKNFTVLGVSLDQEKDKWIEAIRQDGLSWQHVSDLQYWNSVVVNLYHFDGIPFNVLIDPNGKVIASGLRGEVLDQKLAEVLR